MRISNVKLETAKKTFTCTSTCFVLLLHFPWNMVLTLMTNREIYTNNTTNNQAIKRGKWAVEQTTFLPQTKALAMAANSPNFTR